jgi:alkylation response protein AidB-like acyl-CoA dehydrogenase
MTDIGLTESQEAITAAAAEVFTRLVDPTRIEKVEQASERFDRELWSALAEAGLLGVVVPEQYDGLGLGAVELALVSEQLGRAVAPVPLIESALASWLIAAHGDDGQRERWLSGLASGQLIAAIAWSPSTTDLRVTNDRLSGTAIGVPWAHVADVVVVSVNGQVLLVDPRSAGVGATREETTGRAIAATLTFDDTAAESVGDVGVDEWLLARSRTMLSAVQAGVTDAAVRLTASYTNDREQFGKPLSTFQGVALKAADAYLDATAVRMTALQAAWALDELDDSTLQSLTAAWWAADGGQRCVHLTQHLHGGMGADVTYPVHRYFLWAKQIELQLGGASALLAELGQALEQRPDAGDAIVL